MLCLVSALAGHVQGGLVYRIRIISVCVYCLCEYILELKTAFCSVALSSEFTYFKFSLFYLSLKNTPGPLLRADGQSLTVNYLLMILN